MASDGRSESEVTTFDGMTPANASVHGLLVSVSRIKKGRNSEYFDGSITDGDCKLRFVGFS